MILYRANISHSSNEIAQSSGKKTIQPSDVTAALKDCEFEEFIPRLEKELKSVYIFYATIFYARSMKSCRTAD
jgi:hypothetical protein